MTEADYLKHMQEFSEQLRADPVRLKAFMKSVMGPPRRKIEGDEREKMVLLFNLTKPYEESNNQHSWNAMYRIGDTHYSVTSFPGGEDLIEEILEDV